MIVYLLNHATYTKFKDITPMIKAILKNQPLMILKLGELFEKVCSTKKSLKHKRRNYLIGRINESIVFYFGIIIYRM